MLKELAGKREIKFEEKVIVKTPLLVPSFSSKIMLNLNKVLRDMGEIISESVLVSAYDIHHKYINGTITFPSLLFIDSGGYESLKDYYMNDLEYSNYRPKNWSYKSLIQTLSNWKYKVPTAVVSYDHPKTRHNLLKQIEKAKEFFNKTKCFNSKYGIIKEILIKPEAKEDLHLNIDNILKNIKLISEFDIIGVTDKELGENLLDRITAVARLRLALNKINSNIPIHIFGSLDTVTTPLYYLAGADIFDGLSWMRFAFENGQTFYQNTCGPMKFGIDVKDYKLPLKCWTHNISELDLMRLDMDRFLLNYNLSCFTYHKKFFEKSTDLMIGKLKEKQ